MGACPTGKLARLKANAAGAVKREFITCSGLKRGTSARPMPRAAESLVARLHLSAV